ncbi:MULTISPECIES: ABC transporter permease [unclassified Streptomyces]|uniref:ABC transporter permease n=1 Tax=unclassified Streptomyces TaxID=2593676 RepID=UPI002E2E86BE|nr:iron ABC transporter permease [Streptomyces sp. NBC_00223]
MTGLLPTSAPEEGEELPGPVRRLIRARRSSGSRTAGVVVLLLVAAVTLVPIALLLVNSLNTAGPGDPAHYGLENWRTAFGDGALWRSGWNTVRLAVPRVLIGIVIATVISWLIARTDMPGGRIVEVFLWFAFFIPPLSMTLGWILLLDPANGALNQLVRDIPGLGGVTNGPFNIYSYWGIVWDHLTTTTVPIMVILLVPAFRRMSRSMEEAAQTCGAGRLRTLVMITVPVMRPAIVAAALLSFVYSLKTFEIELLLGTPIGLNVYSTQIYNWLEASPPAFGVATALGSVFIPILVMLAIMQRYATRNRSYITVGAHTFNDEPIRLGPVRRWVVAGVLGLYTFVAVVLPMGAIVVGSLMRRFGFFQLTHPFTTAHWSALFEDNLFASSVRNTLLIGLFATLIGVLVYFAVAFAVVRSQLPTRGGIDVMAWLPAAVPGMLLGLGLLWVYLGTPLRTVLYGNLFGLVIALVISHMATGTQQLKAAILQISPDLDRAARICGASPLRAYVHILFPLLGPSVAAAGILTFNAAVSDVSTVVLLSSNNSRPLSLLLLEYSTSGALEQASVLGVLMSVITVGVALLARAVTSGRLRKPKRRVRTTGGLPPTSPRSTTKAGASSRDTALTATGS